MHDPRWWAAGQDFEGVFKPGYEWSEQAVKAFVER